MEVFARLTETLVVLVSAQDAGYYLVGLSRPMPKLFRGIPWGTDRVLADSLAVLQESRVATRTPFLTPFRSAERCRCFQQQRARMR
jgi:glycosyltransferase A (GT-A) superfamily protein (DUF2064 family)